MMEIRPLTRADYDAVLAVVQTRGKQMTASPIKHEAAANDIIMTIRRGGTALGCFIDGVLDNIQTWRPVPDVKRADADGFDKCVLMLARFARKRPDREKIGVHDVLYGHMLNETRVRLDAAGIYTQVVALPKAFSTPGGNPVHAESWAKRTCTVIAEVPAGELATGPYADYIAANVVAGRPHEDLIVQLVTLKDEFRT